MIDTQGFVKALSDDAKATETYCALAVSWFLYETAKAPPSVKEVCNFIEENGVRHNINRHRLASRLSADRRVSAPKGKPIRVHSATAKELHSKFKKYLSPPRPVPKYRLLSNDALGDRAGVLSHLNDQLNITYEMGHFDCAAVMMRRIMECLLIRAFNKSGARAEILDGKNYVGLEKIITRASATSAFHLSRGSAKTMLAIKNIGDKGAHSTSYSIVADDIDTNAVDYRALITELGAL